HMFHQLQQLGIFAEELLARVSPALGLEVLILAIHALTHALHQQAGSIAGKQIVPILAPEHLNDVPTRTAEDAFQLLNNVAIAAHWTVEPLEIAVDDENQVIEFLARGERNRAERLHLVRLAVADEGPDVTIGFRDNAAVFQISHESRLINGIDRADTHADGRKLPEIWHQPRVGIGGQSRRVAQFMPEIFKLLLSQ